ncbi:HAD family hydrolase [Marinomonas pollencensis]|uniref:HAD superfamily hydrolase (TIGR01509 family) n=1 Tax=Marinomonas pollencensis TaxID=491954 RepID=A0A3E0DW40_9GAMM|nr:HAD family phosphatase [Marinomonas pollencensis]REG85879.1 HAD superfamily hydrolase (TIGR01509 family) [Marinomonas pollencensis]
MVYSYKAIIFDCDGVIVDTENISNSIMRSMLQQEGLQIDDKLLHERFSGFPNRENIKTAEAMLGRSLPESFDDDYRKRFHAVIDQHLEPITGVRELLQKVTTPIAMATNARRKEMNFKLSKIQLEETFAIRFCVEDVVHGKPAPDLYLKAADALNVAPEDCIVIEDSVAGIKAAKAAGMRVLAFSETLEADLQMRAGATQCFDTMKQLEELLGLS